MSKGLRLVFAILTLVITLAVFASSLFGFFGRDNAGQHMYLLGVAGLALTVICGFFVYHDYMYFFGGQAAAQTGEPTPVPVTTAPPSEPTVETKKP